MTIKEIEKFLDKRTNIQIEAINIIVTTTLHEGEHNTIRGIITELLIRLNEYFVHLDRNSDSSFARACASLNYEDVYDIVDYLLLKA